MHSETDWTLVWPIATAVAAFGIVYTVSLASNAPAERILLNSTAALLVVGLAAFLVRALIATGRPPAEPPAAGRLIDVSLPAETPDPLAGPAAPASGAPHTAGAGQGTEGSTP